MAGLRITSLIKNIPSLPGVYLFKDDKGVVLYVGKAVSLRSRVSSYFNKGSQHLGFKESMLEKIADIEYIVCETEAKALILEASLIREYKTRYNVMLRDDKSFPYVEITDEEYPCLRVVRKKENKNFRYFGPYLSITPVKEALEIIRKIFPYRSCKRLPERACLYHHINLCPAPCESRIAPAEYGSTVQMIGYILSGEKTMLIDHIKARMQKASDALEFEKAAYYRDKLEKASMLYGVKREFNEMLSLQQQLGLEKMPLRIECVDISGVQFTDTCGSLVVFENGAPHKKEYRRFKVRTNSQDDFRMIEEIVYRRLSRLKREHKPMPDLLIVDGGQIQLDFAIRARQKAGVFLPIIGLAKKNEEIWQEGLSKPLRLKRSDPALKLVQRLRDEAHRFVNNYYQKLHKKRVLGG